MKKNISGSPSRRERERETRRMEIIRAAENVFSRKGFAQASMEEIASVAQFTKRTIYAYFVNKEDLLFAAALEGSRALFARQMSFLSEAGAGWSRIRKAGLAYLEFSQEHPDLFRLIEDARRLPLRATDCPERAAFVRYRTAMFDEYRKAVAAGIDDGSLRRDLDPVKLTYAVVILLHGFIQALPETAGGKLGADRDAFIRSTMDLLFDAIRPRPDGPGFSDASPSPR